MRLFNSVVRKPFMSGLVVLFALACGLATSRTYVASPGITLLIINEGITPITLRNQTRKLAWIFPSTKECVILRNISLSQTLQAQVGRSNLYIISAEFVPANSSTGGWVWRVNERLPFLSTNQIHPLSPPCKR